ncbi:MAG: outer membrane lipoprotein-sorting protein, partial [Nitrospina sp.]|nr:outer membrane lipoprotein-sorting protein [Nitrospina sp.]
MKNFLYFLFIAVFFNVSLATAETPEEKGLAIAQEDDKRDNGFQDFTASMVMVLKNRQGEESSRNIR